jgi:gentisate 1,2-dioxygenase
VSAPAAASSLADLEQFLADRYLSGSWMRRNPANKRLARPEPRTGYVGGVWKWADIHRGLIESGDLVPVGPSGLAEMRSIRGTGAPRTAIDMNAQILMPGERTRAHKNMKNETRLVKEAPPGAIFVCEGEAFPMEPGDLIISPTWTDHDHYNGGDRPAIWVDGYDAGYSGIGAEINERYPVDAPYQAIGRRGGSASRGAPGSTEVPRPPARYAWSETVAALRALKEREPADPYEGFHLMFTSPVDGGPTLPTMAWHVQLLPSAFRTKAHRHNSTTWYHVYDGAGETLVEGEGLEWSSGDIFAVPPWTWHEHRNAGSAEAILFSIDDWPAMTKLGFYRKEER